MGIGNLTTILQLMNKVNGVPVVPSMNKVRDDQIKIEGEDNGIPEDIIAKIDRESSGELGGKSPMNGSPDPDDMIHNEEDNDDPPEWEFSPNSAISQNPEYQFCPHTHRQQILCLFTQHFC